jgi:hypothetical protein
MAPVEVGYATLSSLKADIQSRKDCTSLSGEGHSAAGAIQDGTELEDNPQFRKPTLHERV